MEPEDKDIQFVSKILTEDSIRQEMPEWGDFDEADRKFLLDKMHTVAASRMRMGVSRLEMGENLLEMRDRLEKMGSRSFTKLVKGLNFLSRATAYAYIENYETAVKHNTLPVVKGMMAMGLDILSTDAKPLGKYTEASKRLIPPKTENGTQVRAYLDDVIKAHRRLEARNINREPDIDYDKLVQNVYRSFTTNLRKIPLTSKKRRETFLERAVGMCLWEFGGTSSRTFTAEVPPDEMKLKAIGRPRKESDDEEEAA
jgi:hypothetical protein